MYANVGLMLTMASKTVILSMNIVQFCRVQNHQPRFMIPERLGKCSHNKLTDLV